MPTVRKISIMPITSARITSSRASARRWFSNCPPHSSRILFRSKCTCAAILACASSRYEVRSRSRLSIRIVRLRWPFSRVTVLSPERTRMSASWDSGTCAPLAVFTNRLPSASRRVAGVLRESHRQRIGSFTDIHRRDRRLADAGLDDVLHVGHVHAVARGLFVIQLDLHLRDRRLLENRGAGGALDAVEHVDDLAADAAQLIRDRRRRS